MEEKEESLKTKLSRQLDDVPWSGLREHAARDGIIMLGLELDMVDTGIAFAEDKFEWVNQQVEAGLITKPTAAQLSHFEKNPQLLFRFLIIQPFVLVQPLDD